MNRRSLAITTLGVVMLLVPMLPVGSTPSDGVRPSPHDIGTDPVDLPSGYPAPAAIDAAAAEACRDLPLPGASAGELRDCERYFTVVARDESFAAYETGARTVDELAGIVCGGADCAPVYAADAMDGLSRYQWPRVRLAASLSIASALSYVSTYVS